MTRDEELLNEIIQRRGYLVGGSSGRACLGQQLNCDVSAGTRWYIIATTDRADYDEQSNLFAQFGVVAPCSVGPYFYRILSD